jgi:hypothetical protein
MLGAALAHSPAACSGDGDETTTAAATAATPTQPTSTGAEEQPPATMTEPAAAPGTADPALIADAAAKTAAARSARVATTVRVSDPGRNLQNVADATGVDFGPLVQGSQADPSQLLLWLSALGPGVTTITEEEIRGVPTTRYRAVVDLNLLAGQAPPGKEAEWSAYVQTLRDRIGLEFIPVEGWVDGDGLVRRLHHEHGFAPEGGRATVTTELFDFGVDVNAKAPPAEQATALSDLIRP